MKKNIYLQIGNACLEFDITVRKDDNTNIRWDDPIRLVNNAYAFCFKKARLSTTIGSDIEHNKFCGQVSTILKVISIRDGDLLSQFYNINEKDIPFLEGLADLPPQIRSTSHQKLFKNNHNDAEKGKIKGRIPLNIISDSTKHLGKLQKIYDFNLHSELLIYKILNTQQ